MRPEAPQPDQSFHPFSGRRGVADERSAEEATGHHTSAEAAADGDHLEVEFTLEFRRETVKQPRNVDMTDLVRVVSLIPEACVAERVPERRPGHPDEHRAKGIARVCSLQPVEHSAVNAEGVELTVVPTR
jgi:hypothetical protein